MEEKQELMTTSTELDTPKNLVLTGLERDILLQLADGKSQKSIAESMGIPRSAITSLLRKDGVSEFVNELIEAKNQAMRAYLPELLMAVIEDKLDKAKENETRLADTTRKDIIDIAKQLAELTKPQAKQEETQDRFTQIYQQISVINGGDDK